jgi:hypothetical protein
LAADDRIVGFRPPYQGCQAPQNSSGFLGGVVDAQQYSLATDGRKRCLGKFSKVLCQLLETRSSNSHQLGKGLELVDRPIQTIFGNPIVKGYFPYAPARKKPTHKAEKNIANRRFLDAQNCNSVNGAKERSEIFWNHGVHLQVFDRFRQNPSYLENPILYSPSALFQRVIPPEEDHIGLSSWLRKVR